MRNARAIPFEAALLGLAGFIFAMLANGVSPRGLSLTRDYFPAPKAAPSAVASPGNSTNAAAPGPIASGVPGAANAIQRLQQRGLQSISSNDVTTLFQDPRFQQGLIVFLDARDESHYQAGHIPGAWQFDHYRADAFLPTVLPLCMTAQQVVIYCTGGSCEDSEYAAVTLRDAGVPPSLLFVYIGGITEWKLQGHPIETGARRNGQLLPSKP
ncbi:MAG: hypothetical protein QOF48_1293 [Verrucomicrobiota bacterium]|jgi:rhodanese-related sulfurtransferase